MTKFFAWALLCCACSGPAFSGTAEPLGVANAGAGGQAGSTAGAAGTGGSTPQGGNGGADAGSAGLPEGGTAGTASAGASGTGGDVATGFGSLTVYWTIEGAADASKCVEHGVATMFISLRKKDLSQQLHFQPACTAMSFTADALPVGDYIVDGSLVGPPSGGNEGLTQMVAEPMISITPDAALSVSIDFPAAAFAPN